MKGNQEVIKTKIQNGQYVARVFEGNVLLYVIVSEEVKEIAESKLQEWNKRKGLKIEGEWGNGLPIKTGEISAKVSVCIGRLDYLAEIVPTRFETLVRNTIKELETVVESLNELEIEELTKCRVTQ